MRFLAIGAALSIASAAHSAELKGQDRAALLQLAARMDRAWTAGDINANVELFSIDATARFGDDPLGEGRQAIRQQFYTFFKDRPAGLRHITKVDRTEQLATDLAMWDAEVRVERQQADGKWATLTRIRNVTLLVRQQDGWRIQAVRAFPVS